MRVALVMALIFTVCAHAFAQDFYKWKDEKGVTHITDRPAPNVSEATTSSYSSSSQSEDKYVNSQDQYADQINNQQQNIVIYTQVAPQQPTNQVDYEDINAQIESLRRDIQNLERQKRMDPSMEPPGLRRDIRHKEEMISELMMMKSGQSGQAAMNYRNDKRTVQALEGIERNTRTPHVIVVP